MTIQLFFGAGLRPYGGTAVSWWLGIGSFLFSFILPFSALLFFFFFSFFSFSSLFFSFSPPPSFFFPTFSPFFHSFFSYFLTFLSLPPLFSLYSPLFLLYSFFSFSFSISFQFPFLSSFLFLSLLSAATWKAHHCLHHFTHVLFCSVCPTQQTFCRQSDPALAVALSCCFSLLPPSRS